MKFLHFSAACLIVLLAAGPAAADEVHLYNGQKLEGVVIEKGDRVIVRLDFGTVSVPRSNVVRIVRAQSPLEEFDEMEAKVKSDDIPGLIELAEWAQRKELTTKAREIYKKIVRIDSDNETARRKLGFRLHEGKWMTEEEYMKSQGYVYYEGNWMPREAVTVIEAEERRLEAERERLRTEERIKKIEADVELSRIEAEREAREWRDHERFFFRSLYFSPFGGRSVNLHYHQLGTVAYPCSCNTQPAPPPTRWKETNRTAVKGSQPKQPTTWEENRAAAVKASQEQQPAQPKSAEEEKK